MTSMLLPIRSLLWLLAFCSWTLCAHALELPFPVVSVRQHDATARPNPPDRSTRPLSAKTYAAARSTANSKPLQPTTTPPRSAPQSADGTLARAQAPAEHAQEGPRRPQRSEDAGSIHRRACDGGAAPTGALAYKPVTQVFVTPAKALVELRLDNGVGGSEVIHATAEHPFWVEGRGWTNAGELEVGSAVTTSLGQSAELVGAQTLPERRTVYNLEVADFHTYFVGEGEAWVHNTCRCGGTGDTIRIRHYTNSKGQSGIRADGVIRASDQNKVFAERAKGKPLSARDAETTYGIKKGRGAHIVETDVPAERVKRVHNAVTKVAELQIEGDVPLVNPSYPR